MFSYTTKVITVPGSVRTIDGTRLEVSTWNDFELVPLVKSRETFGPEGLGDGIPC